MKQPLKYLLIIFLLVANFGCDQLTKNLVRSSMNYHEEHTFLSHHLTLIKVENSGAFLSLGNAMPILFKQLFLNILPTMVILFMMGYILIKKDLTLYQLAGICLVAGGGAGNIYDRFRYGSVTDFLHINFTFFQTGIFNIADVSVTTGALILLAGLLFDRNKMNHSIS